MAQLFAGVGFGAILSGISTVVSVIGSLSQARAQDAAAAQQRQAAEHNRLLAERQAQLQERQANVEAATGQRAAIGERRRGAQVSSRALAVSAASGVGALDPTIVNILGDIEFETAFREESALFEGQSAAEGLKYQAVLTRAAGDSNLFAGLAAADATRRAAGRSRLKALGTAFGGASSLYSKFATSPPPGGYTPPPGPHIGYGYG